MKRILAAALKVAWFAGLGVFLAPAVATAQLVPVTRCNAAIPCNIPYGIRPADAANWTPGAQVGGGSALMSLSTGLEHGLHPQIDRPPVSEDPVEAAARMYVRKYPAPSAAKTTAAKAGGPAANTATDTARPETKTVPAPAPTPAPASTATTDPPPRP